MTRAKCTLAVLAAAGLLVTGWGVTPADCRAAEAGRPPLTMEELEVRGYREKPDRLFLPVSAEIRHTPPVRYDLFREEVTRPVLPWEIDIRTSTAGGTRDDEYPPD